MNQRNASATGTNLTDTEIYRMHMDGLGKEYIATVLSGGKRKPGHPLELRRVEQVIKDALWAPPDNQDINIL